MGNTDCLSWLLIRSCHGDQQIIPQHTTSGTSHILVVILYREGHRDNILTVLKMPLPVRKAMCISVTDSNFFVECAFPYKNVYRTTVGYTPNRVKTSCSVRWQTSRNSGGLVNFTWLLYGYVEGGGGGAI